MNKARIIVAKKWLLWKKSGYFGQVSFSPATFKYPLWSLAGDFKMFYIMCIGKMDDEVMRCRGLIKNR